MKVENMTKWLMASVSNEFQEKEKKKALRKKHDGKATESDTEFRNIVL